MENTAILPCEIRPYDHLWDMYYDEFEDEEENNELKNDLTKQNDALSDVGEVGMTIEEWAKDFKSYVNELQMPRDDYKGIMEYIDDAIVMLKEREGLIPALEQSNAANEYLNAEVERLTGLLKEQEALQPNNVRKSSSYVYSSQLIGYCKKCGTKINSIDNRSACGKCGQAVNWNERR